MCNHYSKEFFATKSWLYNTVEVDQFKILLDSRLNITDATLKACEAYGCTLELMIGTNLLMSVFFQHSLETYTTSRQALSMAAMQDQAVNFIALNTQRNDGYEVVFVICQRYLDKTGKLLALELSANHLTRFIRFYSMKALGQSDFQSYFSRKQTLGSDNVHEMKEYYRNKLLGQREHEVLFLLFQCTSSEEISKILSIVHAKSIVPSTIRWIITQSLCKKFEVYNQFELLEKGYQLGYDKLIPRSLLFDGIILLN